MLSIQREKGAQQIHSLSASWQGGISIFLAPVIGWGSAEALDATTHTHWPGLQLPMESWSLGLSPLSANQPGSSHDQSSAAHVASLLLS